MAYLGNSFSQQNYTPATDVFSGNGVTTTFTLTRPIQSVYGIEVVVNNVQQNPSSTYIVNASGQIVFVVAPSAGTNNVYVNYNAPIAQLTGVGQGTVGTQQLGSVSNINSNASNMTLQTNGTTAVTINQSQQVQVGTTAPLLATSTAVTVTGGVDIVGTATPRLRLIESTSVGNPEIQLLDQSNFNSPSEGLSIRYVSANGNSYINNLFNSGNLVFQTQSLDRVTINASGHMLRPKQPAFMIFGTGGATTYADAAEFNIGTGVHYDATNSYSTATGRFTAPVAGFYSFSYGAYTYVGGQMAFKRNGVTWAPSDSIGLCTAGATEIRGTTLYISLAAGDNVSFGWRSGYSGQIYHSHSWFSGHLVG